MAVRIGVDAGGTFTDVCLMTDDGRLRVFKLSSSPQDPSEAIGDGVSVILEAHGDEPSSVRYLGHGTTVATNALLQARGAKTGVITSSGFRDLLELGRQRRPDLYDLQVDKPTTLVRRALRFEVPERTMADGTIRQPLDEDAVRQAVRSLRDARVDSIAVCFLYSYLSPQHEDAVGRIVAEEFPEAYLSLSHEVLGEFREYERLSTTVVNSFVGPLMSRYIQRLRQRFGAAGIPVEPYITQSNGGIISLDVAAEMPVRTVLSGPAAGVVGAINVAREAGIPNLITFDMGGTSTDVALISDGQPSMKLEQEVAGHPIRTPMLDINTVGAGGGSIAWIDSGGHLKVGPQSAGAIPGPACYGNGGTEATVTDANVRLGVLSQEALLGGAMPIDAGASYAAIDALASQLSLDPEQVAQGIVDLATVNMAHAIRVISVERGHDPRDYTLVAFGGAGPLHAGRLARELDIPRVLVPAIPGILCAYGLLVADLRTDFSRTQVLPATSDSLPTVSEVYDQLAASATTWFDREGLADEERRTRRIADMRYVGQNYELPVVLPDGELNDDALDEIRRRFHQAHDQAYGYAADDEPIQFVTLRLEAFGIVSPPPLEEIASGGSLDDALIETRRSYLPEAGGWTDVPLYDRTRLTSDMTIDGPAIVEQMDSTTLILPGQSTSIDRHGNLIVVEQSHTGEQATARPASATELTPITVEILGAAFSSIVEEMGTALIRASYSTNIKERRDCSTILFDAQGRTLVQAQHMPMHLGSLIGIIAEVLRGHPIETLHPGDMFIGNDAYRGGGTHLPDFVVVSPIYYDDEVVGFAANVSHHADFVDRGHAHIFQEGLRVPPVKIFDKGELCQDILDVILLNCQVPRERIGDFRAQFAANRLGVRRFQALCDKYGKDVILAAGEALLDYAERQTRSGVRHIPDGTYRFEDTFDADDLGNEELTFKVQITVKGEEMTFDFTGNPPQVRNGLNLVWTGLLACVYYGVKIVVDPTILPNAGMYRAVHVVSDSGTILNCVEPAAIERRSQTAQRVVDLILGALAPAAPDRVIAACTGANTAIIFSGTDPRTGRFYSYLETIGGGFGARATKDGMDGVQTHITNSSNLPVESLEQEYPLLVEHYELAAGSGGPGKWRGGMGFRRGIRVLGHRATFYGSTSRRLSAPWGLFGGYEGGMAQLTVDGEVMDPSSGNQFMLESGQVASVMTAGAGGYGEPRERDRTLVARDLEDGNITLEQAVEIFGYDPSE